MPLSKDLREFVECFNSNRVEYLMVGALAVSWHGYSRYSADIDFFVRPTAENAAKVLNALRQFGFGGLNITVGDLTAAARVIQLGQEPDRIDLLTAISGVTFDEAWAGRVPGEVDGTPVMVIGREALLRNKDASGRGKDRIDAEKPRIAAEGTRRSSSRARSAPASSR